jgi:hypothetical protein
LTRRRSAGGTGRFFAATYADQNERDHKALVDAVASGRITADQGL